MKKRISVLVLATMLVFAGCGNTTNAEEPLPEEEPSVSEVETPEVIEEEEPAESPVDFDFMIDDEVNGEAIIAHAHELGLLENTWNEVVEINADDILTAYQQNNKNTLAFSADEETSESDYIVRIDEAEIDELITIFVDISLEDLHQSERYSAENLSYEFSMKAKSEDTETSEDDTEIAKEWSIKVEEVIELKENTYEIMLVDATGEAAPIPYGVLTVENNENVPKYSSFVKEIVEEETPAPIVPPPVNNPEPPATPSTPDPTPPATSGTDDSSGSASTGGSWKDDLPGDPDVEDHYVNPDNPDIDWSHLD